MANGLFNLKQVMQAVQQGGWPAQKTPAVEYLVVAGGGAGGYNIAAGGGAGGLLTGLDPVPNGQTLLVTVGGGGSGISGSNSVFGSLTALGGGAGAGPYNGGAGTAGGSGGGGTYASVPPIGQGTSGQGNAGGTGNQGNYSAGGGGGAGTTGLNATTTNGGNGGSGVSSAISGTVTAYAGGGGGATHDSGTAGGLGGVGGGGNGGKSSAYSPTNGTANTGGGGGGGQYVTGGGTGGSGVVIVSYPDTYAAPTATTGSPTVSTSGSGSVLFNGSSQFVQYASNSAFNLGSSNFTIEMWVYRNATGSQTFASQNNSSLTASVWTFDIGTNSSNVLQAEVYVGGTAYTVTTSTTMSSSTWYHIAFVRNSSTLTVYVNGTSTGTASVSGSVNAGSTPMTVGRLGDYNGYYTNGYISNFRYVTGTALYTANFTAPTAPLTPVSGTQLLLNSVSGAYLTDSSTNSFSPASTTVAGSWNAASPFTGTGYKNRVYTWTSSGSITF